MKAHSRMFMKSLKPNWKLPEGYLEKAKASQERIAKKYGADSTVKSKSV